MRCSDVEHLLPQYMDGALPASHADRVDAHLATCSACRAEFSQLQHSLRALNLAAREPAPNLWDQFQARLADSVTAAQCREIEKLVPQYVDGGLEPSQLLQVKDHLEACTGCAQLESEFSRPLHLLDRVGATPHSVDLWSSFSERLATTLSCREAEELLPALLAGEADSKTLSLQSHLASCRSCAASLAAFGSSLSALSRVARSVPEVDLWPAFAERLQKEPAAARRRALGTGRLSALGAWLRGPLLQPALGFAVFALLAVTGHLLSRSVPTGAPGPELAQWSPQVNHEGTANPGIARPAPLKIRSTTPGIKVARRSVSTSSVSLTSTPRAVRRHRTVTRTPERTLVENTPRDDHGSELPGQSQTPGIRVAFNLPSSGVGRSPSSDTLISSEFSAVAPVDERDGMQAVVQAVELLAGSEDALNSPFDSQANEK